MTTFSGSQCDPTLARRSGIYPTRKGARRYANYTDNVYGRLPTPGIPRVGPILRRLGALGPDTGGAENGGVEWLTFMRALMSVQVIVSVVALMQRTRIRSRPGERTNHELRIVS